MPEALILLLLCTIVLFIKGIKGLKRATRKELHMMEPRDRLMYFVFTAKNGKDK